MQRNGRSGRKRHSEDRWGVCLELPGDLIRAVDAYAAESFSTRRAAVESLLEKGLAAESIAPPLSQD